MSKRTMRIVLIVVIVSLIIAVVVINQLSPDMTAGIRNVTNR